MAKSRRDETENTMPVVPTRICDSYDPSPFMKEFVYDDGSKQLYLEVKYRVDWFLHWCKENGVVGRIEESQLDFIPEIRMVLCTCTIYMDGLAVASSKAGRMITDDPKDANVAVQTAFTAAKGRALSNLGFGTVNGNTSENGLPFPPESGIPLPPVTPETNPLVTDTTTPPAQERKRRMRKEPDSAASTQEMQAAPESSPSEPVPTPPTASTLMNADSTKIPETLEEARAFICPIGVGRNKTMGEIELIDPDKVTFYGSDQFNSRAKHPGLVAAAQLIIQART